MESDVLGQRQFSGFDSHAVVKQTKVLVCGKCTLKYLRVRGHHVSS